MFKDLRLYLIAILIFVCACKSTNVQTQSENVQTNQSVNISKTNQTQVSSEPLTVTGEFPINLRKKWQEFTANGQYRLAQISDMTFSEEAMNQLPGKGISVKFYDYAWGDLNYSKRVEDDHLAAIVVDRTKSDIEKFSLVIFSPVKNTKDKYDIN